MPGLGSWGWEESIDGGCWLSLLQEMEPNLVAPTGAIFHQMKPNLVGFRVEFIARMSWWSLQVMVGREKLIKRHERHRKSRWTPGLRPGRDWKWVGVRVGYTSTSHFPSFLSSPIGYLFLSPFLIGLIPPSFLSFIFNHHRPSCFPLIWATHVAFQILLQKSEAFQKIMNLQFCHRLHSLISPSL